MSIKIHGAVIREQGVSFVVLLVNPAAMLTQSEADKTREAFQRYFPDLSIVLASQNARGLFEYQGRPELVRFLALIDASRIPWKECTLG